MEINLSILTILLGLFMSITSIWVMMKPDQSAKLVARFPRATGVGYFLVFLSTAWFLYYFQLENIADYAPLKPYMMMAFIALAVLVCVYVSDFLAVRGLALLLMLLCKLMLDSARWSTLPWHLMIVVWAYIMIIVSFWLTLSPWRMRDYIQWLTASRSRLMSMAGTKLAFGLFLIVLVALSHSF